MVKIYVLCVSLHDTQNVNHTDTDRCFLHSLRMSVCNLLMFSIFAICALLQYKRRSFTTQKSIFQSIKDHLLENIRQTDVLPTIQE